MAKKKAKVLVAMSGGVDSSVSAALLQQKGYDVVGVTMDLMPNTRNNPDGRGCCSPCAAQDAAFVADILGFPHHIVDVHKEFEKVVLNEFVNEYKSGRTPNPCIICNREIKLGILLKLADEFNCEYMATGHYARIRANPKTGYKNLMRAKAKSKDQSYVLYRLSQEQLSRTLFPLGNISDKEETRDLALKFNLFVAKKPDSQDICFVGDDESYAGFLRKEAPSAFVHGQILDVEGKPIGTHKGLGLYTIGQRRRINVKSNGIPMYVINVNAKNNTITVGPDEYLKKTNMKIKNAFWTCGIKPAKSLAVLVKIRYNMIASSAVITAIDGSDDVDVVFKEPIRAITPGQAAVFYRGETVLGGGVID